MRLGIVVTDEQYREPVAGLIGSARAREWDVNCFLTDTGVLLLADPGFMAQARTVPNSVAVCEHSIEVHAGGALAGIEFADVVVVGGQYQDAELVRRCDRVLVF